MLADWFRYIALVEGAILAGFAVAVMVEARKFRAPPAHVYAIAVSYGILVIGYMVEISGRLGSEFSWRVLLAVCSFTFGLYAMWVMWEAYKYASRMKRHDKQTVIAANKLMNEAGKGEK